MLAQAVFHGDTLSLRLAPPLIMKVGEYHRLRNVYASKCLMCKNVVLKKICVSGCVIFIQLLLYQKYISKMSRFMVHVSCVFYVMYVLITFLFAYISVHIFIEVHSY